MSTKCKTLLMLAQVKCCQCWWNVFLYVWSVRDGWEYYHSIPVISFPLPLIVESIMEFIGFYKYPVIQNHYGDVHVI